MTQPFLHLGNIGLMGEGIGGGCRAHRMYTEACDLGQQSRCQPVFHHDVAVNRVRIGAMTRLHPFYSAYGVLVALTVFSLSLWTIKKLDQDEVVGACKKDNVRIMNSATMLVIASLIIGGMALLSLFSDVDKFKERAKERATQQTSGEYEYYVSAIKVLKSDSEMTIRAKITAWNKDEIKEIPVEWKE